MPEQPEQAEQRERGERGQRRAGDRIDRRRMLKFLGAAGMAAAIPLAPTFVAHAVRGETEDPSVEDHQWVMVIDLRLCDGCEKCVDACREMHYLPEGEEWIKVYELTDASGGTYFLPRPCMQCENPPCVRVCPVGATFRGADGVTLIDQDWCIGCRMCLAACPYEARTFAWDPLPAPTSLTGPSPEFPVPQTKGTAGKCVFCVHNLRVGKLPACVEACTMDAVYVGDLATDLVTNGTESFRLSTFLRENDAFRFKEELGTRPRVYYIAGHGQHLDF